jgi:hypothetical protein
MFCFLTRYHHQYHHHLQSSTAHFLQEDTSCQIVSALIESHRSATILHSQEAEYFLGTTPEEFESNQAVRDRIEQRLIHLSELSLNGEKKDREPVIMDFMLTSYVSEVTSKDGPRSAFQLAVSETCIISSSDMRLNENENENEEDIVVIL